MGRPLLHKLLFGTVRPLSIQIKVNCQAIFELRKYGFYDGFFEWSKKPKNECWLYFQNEDQIFIKYLKSLVIIKP